MHIKDICIKKSIVYTPKNHRILTQNLPVLNAPFWKIPRSWGVYYKHYGTF